MSTEKTLEQQLAEIEELLNEEAEQPLRDPGTIVAVATQRSIQYNTDLPEPASSNYTTISETHPLGRLPRCESNVIRIAMAHANHPYIKLRDSARRLGITVDEVRAIRQSSQYMEVVRQRIERNDREGLLARMYRWVTPIDRIYARYFGVPIADIRHILECIFPAWSEIYNDDAETRREIYQAWVCGDEDFDDVE